MEIGYKPYVDPEVESLIARIHPPRICIDNDAFQDCTLVKVDSANKHGVLLEMVQVLTDLDLVISKSYICSDGGWLMDVFHVTDQLGNKIVDESIIHYIQQALCESRRGSREIQTFIGRDVRPRYVLTEHTALEMTGTDRPGLMSEISAVLAEMGCHISAAVAWTHNARAACIVYVEDDSKHGPITDPYRVAQIQAQLENVVEAHHYNGERRSVRLSDPTASRTHTERRLHQLMAADRDYEQCCSCRENGNEEGEKHSQERCYNSETSIKIENCKEKGYSIVTVWSRDRPKLLFDTVCALTDMHYIVFHASISSHDSTSVQGLRLDICTQNRLGLLSDVTRVFRENGLSITRAEIGTQGERAIGTFYVKDTSGQSVDPETLESVRQEIGGTVKVVHKSSGRFTQATSSGNSTRRSHRSSGEDGKPGFSLGSLLWAQLERLSNNFRPIKS